MDKDAPPLAGIKLDIGCADRKREGFVGMDLYPLPGVDIVHDAQEFPYPLQSNSCSQILLSHLWEHIEPKHRMKLMEELWRIMQPGGQLEISSPYYLSFGAYQDPTHYPCPNEATFQYFDPNCWLYSVYKPSPWKLTKNIWQSNGNLDVVLEVIK